MYIDKLDHKPTIHRSQQTHRKRRLHRIVLLDLLGDLFDVTLFAVCLSRSDELWVYGTGESCAVLERLAMVEGRKLRIIHGLSISHKELKYLLQKSTSHRSKVLHAYP